MASSSPSSSSKEASAEAATQSQEAVGAEAQSPLRCSKQTFLNTCETSDSIGVNEAENPDTPRDSFDSSPFPSFLNAVADLMGKGSKAFQDRDFFSAAKHFENAQNILIEKNAISVAEFVTAKFKRGLALQAQFHIEDNIMIEAVPMEADYLVYGSAIVAKQVESPRDGSKSKGNTEDLESAWDVLLDAWKIAKNEPGDSVEKVDILSALGEVALKKGNYDSYKHYEDALPILEHLVESDNQRLAHLYPLADLLPNLSTATSVLTEAIEFCERAILVCKNRVQRLTSVPDVVNVNQETPSSVPVEVVMLEALIREFENKERFKSSLPSTPNFDSPDTRISLDGISGKPEYFTPMSPSNQPGSSEFESPTDSAKRQLSTDSASNEQSSTPGSTSENSQKYYTPMSGASIQPGGLESTPPTAHINETDTGVAAKGAKRNLLTDPSSNESTPTKKHSLDPSAEEDKDRTS
ncbi:uncharacterized protein LOC132277785 [Cornus florida]|uniref:uncharacterized protein LOC132277785 n=1 Tax=Cornus florida TaxID=4283 RepID=UPI0028997886|nr:uncharacterized protein LOC132277785 [Cornus florida]